MMDKNYIKDLVLTCGIGRWLCMSENSSSVREVLLSHGIEAHVGSLLEEFSTGGDDWRPETVFCSGQLDVQASEILSENLKWLYSVTQRSVLLQLKVTEVDGQLRDRGWWEKACFAAGFRVHPRSYHLVPYEAREYEGLSITVALEKMPEAALAAYPENLLTANRILHMDMLRETGRRGDAHCIRYHMAAKYIRPGDTVLDVACGLGYGSHLLFQNSQAKAVLGVDLSDFGIVYAKANYGLDDLVQFRVGDAQNLSFLSDNSVDFITGFETVEHVPFPAKYLAELKRVLRPAGRLMICSPNDWTDETGQDPNPHHLHVYTWERLYKECGELFLLEKGFAQVAGGAIKCHHSPRKWKDAPLEIELDEESEWAVFLCMKNPLEGKTVPYIETTWHIPDSPDFNVSAFERDYKNPWLVKGMVAIGMRNSSESNLRSMREFVLKKSHPDSVDFGAALCGFIYEKIVGGNLLDDEYAQLISRIREYAEIENPSPHQLRWQVSLLFAGGELARRQGRVGDAAAFYTDCASRDVVSYSPLLGNKALDALYWLAVFALCRHDKIAARTHLLQAVGETQRLVSGSWLNISGHPKTPLPFGLAEAAQLLDKASRAAYMLSVLDGLETRPGIVFEESVGFFERQLVDRDRRLDDLGKAVDSLMSVLGEKERNSQSLAGEIVAQDAHAQELARQVAAQDAHAQELARQVAAQDAHAQELARQVAAQDAHAQSLANEVVSQKNAANKFAEELRSEREKTLICIVKERIRKGFSVKRLG